MNVARLGWAGIVVGLTLAVVALMPAFPWSPAPWARGTALPSVSVPAVPQSLVHPGPTAAAPERISIPVINLSAGIVPVDLQPDGSLAAPGDFLLAGWYTGGALPGESGPAIIVGHVDSYRGPAVFFRLHELVPGQLIVIGARNRTTHTFVVERLERHSKDRFPTDEVYGSTTLPELRIITCGGQFNPATRSYRDNIVVFARLAE